MDEDQKELAKIGAEAAMRPFADLIDKLFGEPLGELGGIVKDSLSARRHIRRIGLMKKVQSAIEEAGFEPKRIEDNIWVPAIQEATLQEDETLQERWANLLANAADPRQMNPVRPVFTTILKDLTREDAEFIDKLYENEYENEHISWTRPTKDTWYTVAELTLYAPHYPIIPGDGENDDDARVPPGGFIRLILDSLERNQLVSRNYVTSVQDDVSPIGETSPVLYGYEITTLGLTFMAACRAPKKSQAPDSPKLP